MCVLWCVLWYVVVDGECGGFVACFCVCLCLCVCGCVCVFVCLCVLFRLLAPDFVSLLRIAVACYSGKCRICIRIIYLQWALHISRDLTAAGE